MKRLIKATFYFLILGLSLNYWFSFNTEQKISPEFRHIYKNFLEETNSSLIKYRNIKIEKNERLDFKTLAITDFNDFHPVIYVNSMKWAKLNSTEKEMVIYHELGHALFFKHHDQEEYSIMHENIETVDHLKYEEEKFKFLKSLTAFKSKDLINSYNRFEIHPEIKKVFSNNTDLILFFIAISLIFNFKRRWDF